MSAAEPDACARVVSSIPWFPANCSLVTHVAEARLMWHARACVRPLRAFLQWMDSQNITLVSDCVAAGATLGP
jgi:hypothetical protein